MNLTVRVDEFRRRTASFAPDVRPRERLLALYAAAIALCDEPALTTLVERGREYHIPRESFYEVLLQSYLFLGFPRMLIAAEHLDRQYKWENRAAALPPPGGDEIADWYERGVALCRRVYDGNYDRLKDRVEGMAPEIFQWMLLEGYGKVLSRPGLPIVERELAIIASLMIENRPQQLFSHVRGALNVGAEHARIADVVRDIGEAAGEGLTTAREICSRLQIAL